jgi:hypothetical protein
VRQRAGLFDAETVGQAGVEPVDHRRGEATARTIEAGRRRHQSMKLRLIRVGSLWR